MANLFIFGIGGTGSRVLKALTFLLASGVKIKAENVIPIIIDPDTSNGDLEKTTRLLKKYIRINDYLPKSDDSRFFNSRIKSVDDLTGKHKNNIDFRIQITDANNLRFGKFINHQLLNDANKSFISLLFSEANLNDTMDIGFKGNPNIGSIVLNQLFSGNAEGMMKFASSFKEGDRIFIISSIFGGTGAAGFPLLVKNFRNISALDKEFPNTAFISKAKIGALTVLPYFGVLPEKGQTIDKKTFISKTKAALSYYNRTINDKVNALYYIGDTVTKDYQNNPGASGQKNDAHFVELAGAISIIDFMNQENSSIPLPGKNFFEFGLEKETKAILFDNLGSRTKTLLKNPLTKMLLFKRYLDERYKISAKSQPWARRGNVKLNKSLELDDLKEFFETYEKWLKEMSENEKPFSPYNLNLGSNLKDLFSNKSIDSKKFRWYDSDHFVDFDRYLNKYERNLKEINKISKLIHLFDKACNDYSNNKYN